MQVLFLGLIHFLGGSKFIELPGNENGFVNIIKCSYIYTNIYKR